MDQPPGFVPGFHIPGTLVPMGAVQQQEDERSRKRRVALLLLLD